MKPTPPGLKPRAGRPRTGTFGRQVVTKVTGEGKCEKSEGGDTIFPWSIYEN